MVDPPSVRLTSIALPLALLAGAACGPEPGSRGESGGGEAGGDASVAAGLPPSTSCDGPASALGGSGAASGDVCKITFPRADLEVHLDGATLPPGMGLTSWAAFAPAGDRGTVVMGDLALTSDELPAVMAGLRERGIRVTAVHRHMLGESPTITFVHYLGIGPADSLARALRAAMGRAPTSRGAARGGVAEPPASTRTGVPGVVAGVPCDALARTLGADPTGAATGPGYCKVSRPREDLEVRVDAIPVPPSLGVGSWFAFRETASGNAAVVTGDMALTQEQVNPALAALLEHGLEVVALHNHMLFDTPRVMFFHFQGSGAPGDLAEGLRAGLETVGLAGAR